MTKIKKTLREEADALIAKFTKQVEENLAAEDGKLQAYENESKGKLETQLSQLTEQKTHIEKVLEWAPLVKYYIL